MMEKERSTEANTSSSPLYRAYKRHGKKVFLPEHDASMLGVVMLRQGCVGAYDKGCRFCAFHLSHNEEQWMETKEKTREKGSEGFLEATRKGSNELHHISCDDLDTYPEHQVHENHEKLDDRTARIHGEFIFFRLFCLLETSISLHRGIFSLLISETFTLPHRSFTNFPLFSLKTFFSFHFLWYSVRVANRAIQMFTSDWRETIASETRREGKHSESAAQAQYSLDAFRETETRNVWRQLRAAKPFDKRLSIKNSFHFLAAFIYMRFEHTTGATRKIWSKINSNIWFSLMGWLIISLVGLWTSLEVILVIVSTVCVAHRVEGVPFGSHSTTSTICGVKVVHHVLFLEVFFFLDTAATQAEHGDAWEDLQAEYCQNNDDDVFTIFCQKLFDWTHAALKGDKSRCFIGNV